MNRVKNIRICNLFEENENVFLSFLYQNQCVEISILFRKTIVLNELGLEIEFDDSIEWWRNHDYTWINCKENCISNYYSPKILRLKDGTRVVAGSTEGIWHYKKDNVNKLYWNLVESVSSPLFQYGKNDTRNFFKTGREFSGTLHLKLFFTKNAVAEWSRSLIPFSGILCFTDHCDFDTLLLLQKQRELFKQNNIKVTKGFFQYHFSKRENNTSFDKQKEREEYITWINDGHELAYHSLTQSRKPDNEPFDDFNKFGLKDAEVVTWIDHGYQPYNFTQIQGHKEQFNMEKWIIHVKNKGIKYLWNYLDSGESSHGIINQLLPESFTYGRQFMGRKYLKLIKKISERIRIYLFYYSDESTLLKYRKLSLAVKKFKSKQQILALMEILSSVISLSGKIISAIFPGKKTKSLIPEFASLAPCIFEINSGTEIEITIFQTIAVKDFIGTFSIENLENLSKEGGLCIAHTYFAFLEAHHYGKMFLNSSGEISMEIKETFRNMGEFITTGKLWNPTFKMLAEYFESFKFLEYEFDGEMNELRLKNKPETEKISTRLI